MSILGTDLRDLGELWSGQDSRYVVRSPVRFDTGTAGTPMEPQPQRTAPDDPFKPTDDPQTPAPLGGLATWQCPGCGTIYTMMVNSCGCQTRLWVTTSASTTFWLYPTPKSEMP